MNRRTFMGLTPFELGFIFLACILMFAMAQGR